MRPGGMYSLIFKKLKLERNWKKIVHCSLLQKPFGPFLEEKKRKKLMSNFLLAFILWCFTVGRFLQIFLKILIFKVPEIFWQWKLSCAVEFADFFKLDLYINIPDWQKCVAYLKSPKVLNHSALLCIVCNLTPPPPQLTITIRRISYILSFFPTCLKGAFIVLIFFTEPGSIAFMSLKI